MAVAKVLASEPISAGEIGEKELEAIYFLALAHQLSNGRPFPALEVYGPFDGEALSDLGGSWDSIDITWEDHGVIEGLLKKYPDYWDIHYVNDADADDEDDPVVFLEFQSTLDCEPLEDDDVRLDFAGLVRGLDDKKLSSLANETLYLLTTDPEE
ncbi:hypothetical protein [Aquiluna sp. KACHI24]|uniref:hypothetical protein n=1 Tax=Aquiluna sp. KACHI24 TaxID=2968831 RepID=UPI00220A27C8|nr:hypothetical protein [Aquiluna sp. KACHI24]BDQ00941.1 hypothetical protein AKACHI_12770 [Aquiluna sp. KACHI24]